MLEVVLDFVQKQLNLGWGEIPLVHVVVWARPHPPNPAFEGEEMRAGASSASLWLKTSQKLPAQGIEPSGTSQVPSHLELCAPVRFGDGKTAGLPSAPGRGWRFLGWRGNIKQAGESSQMAPKGKELPGRRSRGCVGFSSWPSL